MFHTMVSRYLVRKRLKQLISRALDWCVFVDYRVQSLGIFILIVVHWWGILLTADIAWLMWCVLQYSLRHKFLFTFVPLLLSLYITSGCTLPTCGVSSLFMLLNSFWVWRVILATMMCGINEMSLARTCELVDDFTELIQVDIVCLILCKN